MSFAAFSSLRGGLRYPLKPDRGVFIIRCFPFSRVEATCG
jgi:hypothetical protein